MKYSFVQIGRPTAGSYPVRGGAMSSEESDQCRMRVSRAMALQYGAGDGWAALEYRATHRIPALLSESVRETRNCRLDHT